MRRVFAIHGDQGGIEDRIPNQQMAVLVILVSTSTPVGHDDVGTMLADAIPQCLGDVIVERYLRVRISQNLELRAEHRRCFPARFTLHIAVSFHRDASGSPLFTRAQRQEQAFTAIVDVLGNSRTHREDGIAGMSRDCHQSRRHWDLSLKDNNYNTMATGRATPVRPEEL